jgi:arabinose-5-phosphate isomerase
MSSHEKFCELGLAVIQTEAQAITNLTNYIDEQFAHACRLLLECQGRIIVIGMGKSGHIGNKIAATLASTGSPAFFVHPAEASHGDFGMITQNDVILALSNSGETAELVTLLPLIKLLDIKLIAITGNPYSTLAKAANIHLNIGVTQEACPLGLAPTSSTTATLVLGDALAIALLEVRGFTSEDFAKVHPKGSLGLRLLLRVDAIMHTADKIPVVTPHTLLSTALIEITQKRLGMTTIVDHDHKLVGIFTDGDLRRVFDRNIDIHTTTIDQVMVTHCKTIESNLLATEALHIMESHKITALVVVDSAQKVIGVIHIHDILLAGMK